MSWPFFVLLALAAAVANAAWPASLAPGGAAPDILAALALFYALHADGPDVPWAAAAAGLLADASSGVGPGPRTLAFLLAALAVRASRKAFARHFIPAVFLFGVAWALLSDALLVARIGALGGHPTAILPVLAPSALLTGAAASAVAAVLGRMRRILGLRETRRLGPSPGEGTRL